METKQESEQTESGSTEYIGNHEIDKVLKKVKDDIKHYMAVAGLKEYKYKAGRVVAAAKELDKLDYPKSEICARLTKTLKGLVSERHVREALDAFPEYKNAVKSAEAHGRGDIAANTMAEQILKKAKQRITSDDVKHLNLPKAKEVLNYQMAQAEWWKQQLRQDINQVVELARNTKYNDAEFREAFRELAKKLEDQIKAYTDIEANDNEPVKPKQAKRRGRPKSGVGKMGKAKEKMDLLAKVMAARADGRI
jgi:multidrug efflux pump subunit AcrB